MTLNTNLLLTAALLLPLSAEAHATLEVTEAAPGAPDKAVVRIAHGCDSAAIHTVKVTLPQGSYDAKPMPVGGWTLETIKGTYAQPYINHGTAMTEGTTEVIWSGGDLHDDWYGEFVIRGTIGPDLARGTVLHFPTVQICEGAALHWTDTSGAKGVPNAAPSLTLTGGPAKGITAGDLALSGAFARATLPNAPVAGGFLTIANAGPADDRLIGARSPAAGHMEIHEMTMQGDVMQMRALADGLPLPAGETVTLKPGGYHLMFMDLAHPLVQGATVPVTLTFERAGEVEVPLIIGAPNARDAGHGGH